MCTVWRHCDLREPGIAPGPAATHAHARVWLTLKEYDTIMDHKDQDQEQVKLKDHSELYDTDDHVITYDDLIDAAELAQQIMRY